MRHKDWLGYILTIVGLILNGKMIIWCWPIWIVSDVVWIWYFYPKRELAVVILNITFIILNFYGWYQWSVTK